MNLLAERRAKLREQIRLHIAANSTITFDPTDHYPGSPAKVEVFIHRLEEADLRHLEPSLFHQEDAKMPLGKGWRFVPRGNGRVPMVDKIEVDLDQANTEKFIRDEIEEVDKILAGEKDPCPSQVS